MPLREALALAEPRAASRLKTQWHPPAPSLLRGRAVMPQSCPASSLRPSVDSYLQPNMLRRRKGREPIPPDPGRGQVPSANIRCNSLAINEISSLVNGSHPRLPARAGVVHVHQPEGDTPQVFFWLQRGGSDTSQARLRVLRRSEGETPGIHSLKNKE